MKGERVFEFLKQMDTASLLQLVEKCYDVMTIEQREIVFGEVSRKMPAAEVDGEMLLDEIQEFQRQSKAKVYWAPFDINSKNFSDVPEETQEWFDRMGDFLKDSAQLTKQQDHQQAVACFRVLYELIDDLESGEEIVFGEEMGSWMIPIEEKEMIAAIMTSLAAIGTPEEFTAQALPFIRRDSHHSFAAKAYDSARRAADKAQKAHLDGEIKRQKIRTNA